MRHRSLQNGRDAGSIGRRRQYTQRGSDCAKPAHCINGAEIAETPDAARAGWPFDPPAQRAAGLHGSLGYRVTLDADCADHGLKRDADHADQGIETRRGSRGSGTWKRDADHADQELGNRRRGSRGSGTLETRRGSRGSGLGNETRIARIRTWKRDADRADQDLETRRGSRGSGTWKRDADHADQALETRRGSETRCGSRGSRTGQLSSTGRAFRGSRLGRDADFADHDLNGPRISRITTYRVSLVKEVGSARSASREKGWNA